MRCGNKLAFAFKLFEEKKFIESKELYEKILESPLSIDEEIQLRYGYGYPLSELGFVEEANYGLKVLEELL